ncbi:MAG: hypothetical protein JW953_03455 [Anaerolineae bacterium]|nr:hypothetical protein [Anaerolineae bacterium]
MDLTPLLIWWLITFIVGLVGWPLAFCLLRFLPDRGFAFARPVGLLLAGYILWLGGTFRLLQNNSGGILIALVLVLALGLLWRRQQVQTGDRTLLTWLKQEWRYVLAVELLFHLALVGWTIFKAYNPNIETAGGEKWMEIAFINGTLNSDYFPPQDPWLSGFAISYYYFGYVLMAMLTRLSGQVSTIAFNLYIPTLLALTLTAAFGLGANLINLYQSVNRQFVPGKAQGSPDYSEPGQRIANLPAVLTGFVAALFVAFLGNLEGLLEVFHERGLFSVGFWAWLDIRNLKEPPVPGSSWIPDRFIWWWRGSRVLTDYTPTGQEQEVIDEFPFFSFLLGDVHPHVLALPFVLLVVALALNLLVSRQAAAGNQHQPAQTKMGSSLTALFEQTKMILKDSWQAITEATGGRLAFALYAVFVGGLSFLNTWDFPIYLSVVGLAFILWLTQPRTDKSQSALVSGIIGVAILGVAGIILYFPFYATFQSQARGILPNLWNPTRLPQFFVFFGPFLVAGFVFLLVLSRQYQNWQKNLSWSLPLTVLGPILLMLASLVGILFSPSGRRYIEGILSNPEIQQALGVSTVGALAQVALWQRIHNPWTFLLVGGLVGWALALLVGESAGQRVNEPAYGSTPSQEQSENHSPTSLLIEKFILILLLVGLGLTLAVEFIYLRDNFGIRMNTVFKFYFQAWVLLALASAFALYAVSKNLRGFWVVLWQVGMGLLVAGGLVYPILAIPNKANNFQDEPTLNSIRWIAEHHPGDYAAIQWLRANAPPNAVILEAHGGGQAYSYTNRISALTGLPTPLGWGNHEAQWRGNYDEPGRRELDIEELFNTIDFQRAQELLDKYNITYVYVGLLEKERYSAQGLKKFAFLMDVVFEQDNVTIYQRR